MTIPCLNILSFSLSSPQEYLYRLGNFLFPHDRWNTCVQSYFIWVFVLIRLETVCCLAIREWRGNAAPTVMFLYITSYWGTLWHLLYNSSHEMEACMRDPVRPQATAGDLPLPSAGSFAPSETCTDSNKSPEEDGGSFFFSLL